MNQELVKAGFATVADKLEEDRDAFDHRRELVEFARFLPKGGHVLDAGCGVGVPAAKFLIDEKCQVTGVDLVPEMVAKAKKNVPEATFMTGDILDLPFAPMSFDGIVSLHAIVHIPREKHEDIFRAFHTLLKHQGVLMISSATEEFEGVKDHYDAPMFWSHHGPEETVDLIRKAGFNIVSDYHVELRGKLYYWIIARNW